MDPLTALGLASNIVQFVDYSSKLISTTRKIYNSASGAKEEYIELELLARNIRELAERAKSGPRTASYVNGAVKETDVLLDLSNQCIEVSSQLLSVLESVKVKGQHRGWDSFYQVRIRHFLDTVNCKAFQYVLGFSWYSNQILTLLLSQGFEKRVEKRRH